MKTKQFYENTISKAEIEACGGFTGMNKYFPGIIRNPVKQETEVIQGV